MMLNVFESPMFCGLLQLLPFLILTFFWKRAAVDCDQAAIRGSGDHQNFVCLRAVVAAVRLAEVITRHPAPICTGCFSRPTHCVLNREGTGWAGTKLAMRRRVRTGVQWTCSISASPSFPVLRQLRMLQPNATALPVGGRIPHLLGWKQQSGPHNAATRFVSNVFAIESATMTGDSSGRESS